LVAPASRPQSTRTIADQELCNSDRIVGNALYIAALTVIVQDTATASNAIVPFIAQFEQLITRLIKS
jgi:hypothetical protein